MTSLAEDNLYADRIVYARSSPYQRIVVTQKRGEFQLFLNGNLQFNSIDEYRYHEALVHPAMGAPALPAVSWCLAAVTVWRRGRSSNIRLSNR